MDVNLQSNFATVEAAIQVACHQAQRKREDVTLLAVSKHQPLSAIITAQELGHRHFGENYVQELQSKAMALVGPQPEWHLIGPLQKNKVKKALLYAAYFHALDSVALCAELGRQWLLQNQQTGNLKPLSVFLQINIDHEATKAGVSQHEAPQLLELALQTPGLRVLGLMCIPERNQSESAFAAMANLRLQLLKYCDPQHLKLSMGMSSDYALAIKYGAHYIRIGEALFGPRLKKE